MKIDSITKLFWYVDLGWVDGILWDFIQIQWHIANNDILIFSSNQSWLAGNPPMTPMCRRCPQPMLPRDRLWHWKIFQQIGDGINVGVYTLWSSLDIYGYTVLELEIWELTLDVGLGLVVSGTLVLGASWFKSRQADDSAHQRQNG